MIRSTLALVALAVFSGTSLAQLPDRSQAPVPGAPPALKLPAVQKRTLSNGLPVWLVALHEVPVAHVSLVLKSGGGTDPAGKFGIAALTAEMIDEGAGTRTALEIADAVEVLGASLSTASSFDSSSISLQVPAARLGDALPIMADVALRPTFPDEELERVRKELLTSLIQAEDNPAALVSIAFPRIVFGPTHRYGTPEIGTAASLSGFTVEDLRQFHRNHYVPSNALLLVTGDVAMDRVLPLLESAFGSWQGRAAAAPDVPTTPQLTERRVYLVDKPGAAQSQIRIGWVGVPRSTKDYFALQVLNTVLGGSFTSRLNTNLREEHGYSYGARSTFQMFASAGPFYATAGVQTDKTAESLREFFNELNGIREPIPEEELEKAKNYVALLLPRAFETTAGVARSLAQLFIYGLPEDFYATYTDRVLAVSSAEVAKAAQTYIQPDKFAVVVVGDRSVIEPGIRALDLGPIEVVTVEEVMK